MACHEQAVQLEMFTGSTLRLYESLLMSALAAVPTLHGPGSMRAGQLDAVKLREDAQPEVMLTRLVRPGLIASTTLCILWMTICHTRFTRHLQRGCHMRKASTAFLGLGTSAFARKHHCQTCLWQAWLPGSSALHLDNFPGCCCSDSTFMVVTLVTTIATFQLLYRQKTSIIPVLSCIAFGLSVCFTGVSALRWWSAFR
jgi:hypothetical protein